MNRPVNRVRSYDSTRRQEQARQNRARILDAARAHFLTDGYQGTTVSAVAVDAGVSVETVYKAFANKAGLLKAVFDVTLAGDDEPVPMMDREEIRRNAGRARSPQETPDVRRVLRRAGRAPAVPFEVLARDAGSRRPSCRGRLAADDAGAINRYDPFRSPPPRRRSPTTSCDR